MDNNILKIVNTVLANRGRVEIRNVNKDLHLRDDIGFDSLDLAELTVRIEAEYDIDIFEDGIVSTLSEIVDKVNDK